MLGFQGDRPGFDNVAVILTDGRSDAEEETWQEAIATREAGVEVGDQGRNQGNKTNAWCTMILGTLKAHQHILPSKRDSAASFLLAVWQDPIDSIKQIARVPVVSGLKRPAGPFHTRRAMASVTRGSLYTYFLHNSGVHTAQVMQRCCVAELFLLFQICF